MTTTRPLQASDEAAWRPLWKGYLDFYKASLDEAATAEIFRRLVEDQRYFAFVAVGDEAVVGLVHCVVHASTWSAKDYCYLGDLFVAPEERGRGTGRHLIERVYEEAKARDLARVHWLTHEENPARRLYDQLASYDGFVQYRRRL